MKTRTLPPIRVSPELRREAEAVLADGETLSSFMVDALRRSIEARREQRTFVERGLASARRARRTGTYVSADAVLGKLEKALATAKRARR